MKDHLFVFNQGTISALLNSHKKSLDDISFLNLKGEVGVLWLSEQRERRRDSLKQGDSIYIDSWVPHAFYSIVKDSHIFAIDYF